MKVIPILFSGPMVRALLDGHKTQTRRIVKYSPPEIEYCKYQPRDLLWVRETFINFQDSQEIEDRLYKADCDEKTINDLKGHWHSSMFMPRWASRITLEVIGVRAERLQDISEEDAEAEGIEIMHIEGFGRSYKNYLTNGRFSMGVAPAYARGASYETLWESINGAGSWDLNPWVWVIEFKMHQINIDKYLRELK